MLTHNMFSKSCNTAESDVFCTWSCCSSALLLQVLEAFLQSCVAACHLLLDTFLLAGQAASTKTC